MTTPIPNFSIHSEKIKSNNRAKNKSVWKACGFIRKFFYGNIDWKYRTKLGFAIIPLLEIKKFRSLDSRNANLCGYTELLVQIRVERICTAALRVPLPLLLQIDVQSTGINNIRHFVAPKIHR